MTTYDLISTTNKVMQAQSSSRTVANMSRTPAPAKGDVRDPEKIAIGRRIREARDVADMSQHDLAIKLGVTAGAVGQWELGITIPKSVTLNRLPSILGVSRDWLVGAESRDSRGMQAHGKDEELALSMFRKLQPAEQSMMLRQMSGLLKSK